jgi:RHS repeat-associated protein
LVYFHRNHQYSVTAITTSTGAIAERYAYTAYGQPTILDASASVLSSSAINNRYTYTGREWDATLSLHHFRARWMSGLSGRFVTRDPIGYEGSPNNLYQFLKARAVVDRDPSGLCVEANEEPEPIGFGCVVFYYSINNNTQCLASCAHRSDCCRMRGNLICRIYAHRICPRGLRGQTCMAMEVRRCLALYIPACFADENYCRAWCNSSYPN